MEYLCSCHAGYTFDPQKGVCRGKAAALEIFLCHFLSNIDALWQTFKDIDEAEAGSCDCDDVCINKFLDRDGVKFVCECSDVNTVLSIDGRTCEG